MGLACSTAGHCTLAAAGDGQTPATELSKAYRRTRKAAMQIGITAGHQGSRDDTIQPNPKRKPGGPAHCHHVACVASSCFPTEFQVIAAVERRDTVREPLCSVPSAVRLKRCRSVTATVGSFVASGRLLITIPPPGVNNGLITRRIL